MSEVSLHNWKANYDGMDVSEAKRLKALDEREASPGQAEQCRGVVVVLGVGCVVHVDIL